MLARAAASALRPRRPSACYRHSGQQIDSTRLGAFLRPLGQRLRGVPSRHEDGLLHKGSLPRRLHLAPKRGEPRPEQHFTQPPPRYSEASLVKKLEELGIGRPSTYASIIEVLQTRGYVKLEKRRFLPEDRGRLVTAFL